MLSANVMEKEWDQRAQLNALHYIDTGSKDWDIAEFFNAGEEFVKNDVDPYIAKYVEDAHLKSALDIGCGAGRITRALAKRFREVKGVDVSSKMIELALSNHPAAEFPNIAFIKTDGMGFATIPDSSIDYVFSVVTFQHMPTPEVVMSNIRDIHRVLKPGGVVQIDFTILQGWGQLFGFLPFPRRMRRYVPEFLIQYYRSRRIPDEMKRTETFRGANFTKREAYKAFAGFDVCLFPNSWTTRKMWVVGRKK